MRRCGPVSPTFGPVSQVLEVKCHLCLHRRAEPWLTFILCPSAWTGATHSQDYRTKDDIPPRTFHSAGVLIGRWDKSRCENGARDLDTSDLLISDTSARTTSETHATASVCCLSFVLCAQSLMSFAPGEGSTKNLTLQTNTLLRDLRLLGYTLRLLHHTPFRPILPIYIHIHKYIWDRVVWFWSMVRDSESFIYIKHIISIQLCYYVGN